MKQLITTTFTSFVNENFSNDSNSSCCNAPLTDDKACSKCGAYETNEDFEDQPDAPIDQSDPNMPTDVANITKFIVDGNFEKSKIMGMDGNSVKVRMSDQDFKYAPDTLALRDFGFEAWSAKPYDVKLKLEDADPSEKVVTYSVEFVEKEAKRAKADNSAEPEFKDEYENQPDEFDDLPETPEDDTEGVIPKDDSLFKDVSELPPDEDDDDELVEGRKKKQDGGFAKLKVKNAPRYSNPNNKARRDAKKRSGGFKKGSKRNLMKRVPKKMTETKPEPIIKEIS